MHIDDVNRLISEIQSVDEDRAIDAVFEIENNMVLDAIPKLLVVFESTESIALRNAISLALRGLMNEKAMEPIMKMLCSKKTKGYRGTLLYALEGLDCQAYIADLVEIAIAGNFEEFNTVVDIIERFGKRTISSDLISSCLRRLDIGIETTEHKMYMLEKIKEQLMASDWGNGGRRGGRRGQDTN